MLTFFKDLKENRKFLIICGVKNIVSEITCLTNIDFKGRIKMAWNSTVGNYPISKLFQSLSCFVK